MVSHIRFAAFLILGCSPLLAQQGESLDFLSSLNDFRGLRTMVHDFAKKRAYDRLEVRGREIARLNSAAGVAERRRYLRERMIRALGGLPERTPLNARVVATLDREDYKIEKVIFESQPKFFVTANLYLPKRGQPPYPGILFPLGHEAGAKSHNTWQQLLISFAKKGYVALAWDTLGQGERIQLYDEDFRGSKVVRSTTEHSMLGIPALLAGDTLARYTIWDGIRALDYLLSRKEVDPKRIGCTGNSGGGTHTAYLSALDDRIHVAAPSCYLTSWRRLLETIGPQDAEQCIPPWIADGLDHPDFVHAFAPKPYLILSAIRDFFSIAGARETYQEAQRVYEILGAKDRLAMTEADDGHGYSKPRRLAAYRWFGRWLKGAEDNDPEPEVEIATEKELECTPTGQVATSLGGETVFTLNRRRAGELRRPAGLPAPEKLGQLIGFEKPAAPVTVRSFGVLERGGYRIEKLVYDSEPGMRIPALLFLPDTGTERKPAAIFVHGRGKSAAAGIVEPLVRGGQVVLAIDARGFGETRRPDTEAGSDWNRAFGDYDLAMTVLLTGQTLAGMRVLDIVRGLDVLAARAEVDPNRLSGLAAGGGTIPLLHAAYLDSRIRRVVLDGMLVSYQSVIDSKLHRGVFEHVVPGALRSYDLPDLVAALAPRPVSIVDPVTPLGLPADSGAGGLKFRVRRPEEPVSRFYQEAVR